MNLYAVLTRKATRELRKRAPLEGRGTGFTTVPDGREELSYSAFIDLDNIDALARKAAGNKNGRAKDGALHVIIEHRRRLEVTQ